MNTIERLKDTNSISSEAKYVHVPYWKRKIKFRDVARLTVSFPLTGFIFGVFYALYIDPEKASRTDCGAKNYLPSASAAIAGFPLSESFWKFCIGMHALPRYGVAVMYYRYMKTIVSPEKRFLTKLTSALYILEISFLLALTIVSSVADYVLHQKFFVVFLVASTLYMMLFTYLLSYHRNSKIMTNIEKKSFVTKRALLLTFLVSCVLASAFFVRHRMYCEDGMYTVFSFLEYIVILSNMGFHMTAYWDFYHEVISIG